MANTLTPAIERFSSEVEIEVNLTPVYATYTSGNFNGFYDSEDDAIAHCAKPGSGTEFNGTWYQDRYSTFLPGELFVETNKQSVYMSNDRSRFLDAIGGRSQMPFVKWGERSPKPVVSVA